MNYINLIRSKTEEFIAIYGYQPKLLKIDSYSLNMLKEDLGVYNIENKCTDNNYVFGLRIYQENYPDYNVRINIQDDGIIIKPTPFDICKKNQVGIFIERGLKDLKLPFSEWLKIHNKSFELKQCLADSRQMLKMLFETMPNYEGKITYRLDEPLTIHEGKIIIPFKKRC